ncbi:ATPase family protein associated with various cellular activities (AAA) [Chitinophaga polysaccharea]|uniref:ATPase family protein associated with various cellular activities (AAA) n=1 Tax=Chitinophaga polysaccharea TaxID=1293035 RepID=A0A561PNC6_9BACT|nr:ATP-binding protein [Chitinophaga polysaccharea]TWF39578.1 ATPase family protein associated with various cellular activities (AAA) [Chitinophaga polysaccharea]
MAKREKANKGMSDMSVEKLAPIANKSFSYNDLADDRRFEELVYSLYKRRIEKGELPEFDTISLMQGVGEKGRDSVLLKQGRNRGVIQCKKHKNSLSKSDFGLEITKFALHRTQDEKLISDLDDFTYYIAVSTGFVQKCTEFIDQFSELIEEESDLNSWITQNINSFKRLSHLDPVLVRPKVLAILLKIKIRKIFPVDMDVMLSNDDSSDIIQNFFSVRVVTDNSAIQRFEEKFDGHFNKNLDNNKLKAELQRGSSSLRFEKNVFADIPDSHIERIETEELLMWVKNDVVKDKEGRDLNICLLAGNAGIGKTTILKDLYDKLEREGIATLALKADKLYASNMSDLQQKIGLSIPVYDFIEQCKQQYSKTILIFDQIDALSQALSSNREYINTFKSLIDNYTHDENIRIIISIRTFDLHFDPSLNYYKGSKTIDVRSLSDDQVLSHLERLGVSKLQVSSRLIELLRIPNNLNVFSKIVAAGETDFGFTSLQSLYSALWKQKVSNISSLSNLSGKDVKKVAFFMVKCMFEKQQITIGDHLLDDYNREVLYLESEHLITRDRQQVQFFHQTFYDYVFAKRFIEDGENLVEYIKQQDQSIHVRSAIKMILSYLRDFDPKSYFDVIKCLFEDNEICFHIKHLLMSILAYIDEPFEEEYRIVLNAISSSIELEILLVKHCRSTPWLIFLIRNNLLAYLEIADDMPWRKIDVRALGLQQRNERFKWFQVVNLIRYHIERDNSVGWDFLMRVNDNYFIWEVLFRIDSWKDPRLHILLEKCKELEDKDPIVYQHILEQMSETAPHQALSRIRLEIDLDDELQESVSRDEKKVLSILSEKIPEKMINFLTDVFVSYLGDKPNDTKLFSLEWKFDKVNWNSEQRSGIEYIYWLLGGCLRTAAGRSAPEFVLFLKRFGNSVHTFILRLLVYSLTTNEQVFHHEIYELFRHLHAFRNLRFERNFDREFRALLQLTFSMWGEQEQLYVINAVKYLIVQEEIQLMKDRNHRYKIFGECKHALLQKFPQAVIDSDLKLRRDFLELNRKFGVDPDTILPLPHGGMVRNPLKESAYKKMGAKQWLKSFKRYNKEREHSDYKRSDFLKGGLYQHAQAFRNCIKENPNNVVVLVIAASIGDNSIHIDYIIMGLLGLTEANVERAIILPLFKRVVKERTEELSGQERLLITVAGYLISGEVVDIEVLNLLISFAEREIEDTPRNIYNTEPSQKMKLLEEGVNSIPGAAIIALVHVVDKRYEDLLFSIVEKILETGGERKRACMYFKFAYLMNLNLERTCRVFVDHFNKEQSARVQVSALWSLSYISAHAFDKVKKAIGSITALAEISKDEQEDLFPILYRAYLYDESDSEDLLDTFIDKFPDVLNRMLYHVTENYLLFPNKSHRILLILMNKAALVQKEEARISLFNIDHIPIDEIEDVIRQFIDMPNFTFSNDLLDYLTEQCARSPFKCVELFNLCIERSLGQGQDMNFFRGQENAVKFVVAAFNTIKLNDMQSRTARNRLLTSLDTTLKDFRFGENVEAVLEEIG